MINIRTENIRTVWSNTDDIIWYVFVDKVYTYDILRYTDTNALVIFSSDCVAENIAEMDIDKHDPTHDELLQLVKKAMITTL